ncbi:MAG: tRNA pseudouridine(38-40) synthase TruA [Thermoanaerobaculia bacterium]|nr:tRNA pseudouridine(38-40) synthase TruA [Thermoanaerobaculia bacterium]
MNARTVQGAMLSALRELAGEGVTLQGAGRTDAGVHALRQVASVHIPAGVALPPLEVLTREFNDRLPPDIHVLAIANAASSFHARHDASLRIYRYRFSRRRSAFAKPYVWWVKDRLDIAAMAKAAALFPGRHDFSSFCENAEGHESTIVEVAFATVEAAPNEPDLILFRIGASHFLWKMVRRLAGTLVQVGNGSLPVSEVSRLLTERSTKPAEWTAPPSGLFLEAVHYPGEPAPPPVDPLRPAF